MIKSEYADEVGTEAWRLTISASQCDKQAGAAMHPQLRWARQGEVRALTVALMLMAAGLAGNAQGEKESPVAPSWMAATFESATSSEPE